MASSHTDSGPHVDAAVLISDGLRTSLTRFAGAEGFASLLRRALVLASAEVPALRSVRVGVDGRLHGLEQIAADTRIGAGSDGGDEAAVAITAHLLGLLVVFIGEPYTMRLVRAAWPALSVDEERTEIEDDE